MLNAEYQGNEGFLQRDSVEHEGYAEVQSTDRREGRERDGASDLLEAILDRNNLNRAYKRVKRNHGAAGIDRRTVEDALPFCGVSEMKAICPARYGERKSRNQMAECESWESPRW